MSSLPGKTKAAILVEQRKPLEIAEIDLPETLDVGQVLVRVHYSGICGSQLGEIDGVKGADRFLPHLLGHEGTATVLATGPGVRHVSQDDKVVLHWRKGPGIEAALPRYSWKGRTVNAGWVTTFNEYAVISENRLTRLAPGSDLDVGVLFGCAVTTGFGVVLNNAKLRIGESVIVYGAGGVGLNVVQAAAMVSAYPVIAVDLFPKRLELASKLGATHVVNGSEEDPDAAIRKILGDRPLDVFIDNTGQPSIIEKGYRLTGAQGRTVLVGVPAAGRDITIHSLPLHFGKKLFGSHGGEAVPETDIPRYNMLYREGRLDLRSLITQEFTLDRINEAIAGMRDGTVSGRCLIRFP